MPIRQKTVGTDVSPRTSRKRERTISSPVKPNSSTTAEKSEAVAGNRRAVHQILENFEHEMTCPMCVSLPLMLYYTANHLRFPVRCYDILYVHDTGLTLNMFED